jgi:hypothetical protein
MSTRLGLALGLSLATAIATWWLGASRVAIESGRDTALLAAQALFVLALLRSLLLTVSAPRVAAREGYAAGVRSALPVVTAAWPVVALAWAASTDSIARTLVVEIALLGVACVAPLPGYLLARWRPGRASNTALATLAGVVVACGVWLLALHVPALAGSADA